jgi:hypothetical protein
MKAEEQRQLAADEALFRARNESIRASIEQLGDGRRHGFMCECALTDCSEMLELTLDEYAHVRSKPTWFAVLPEHVVREIERPVEKHDEFWIVEKTGVGRDVAAELAPDPDTEPTA